MGRRFGGQKIFSPFWFNLRGKSNRALRKILQYMVKTPVCKKSLRAGLGPKFDPPKKKSTFQKNFSPFWENLRGESNRALRKISQNMVKTPICKKSPRAGLGPKVDPPKKKIDFSKKFFFCLKR